MNPRVEAYVRELAGEAPLLGGIHAADEMYLYNLRSLRGCEEAAAILYYLKGRQIFLTVREILDWRFGGFASVSSFLDFASGFGRFTRFLVQELSPERVCVSEIVPEAVHFQGEAFGVRGLVSTMDPGGFRPTESFDVVLASSFFSHLPGNAFEAWMARLFGLVSPGGLLIFSVHGRTLLSDPAADWSEGIVFRPESETKRLDSSVYGTAYVTDDYVRGAVERATGREGTLAGFPFGFCAHQDLYVLARLPQPERPPLAIRRFPRGDLDSLEVEEQVRLGGWVEVEGVNGPNEVRLRIRDSFTDRMRLQDAPVPGRWRFIFDRSLAAPDDVVRIEAEGAPGFTNILAMGTLRPLLRPAGARGSVGRE